MNGTGWTPGTTVTVEYIQAVTNAPGPPVTTVVDQRGRFSTSLSATDSQNIPGNHTVQASNGAQQSSANFNATA